MVAVLPFDCHFHDCVALTFDDGPNKQFTPQLLDALADAGVPATFFVQGQFVSGSNVDLVGRMAAEGHDVGSISWRHTQLHTLDAGTLAKWFKDTDEVISAASGRPVTLFRPPDGAWSDTEAQAASRSSVSERRPAIGAAPMPGPSPPRSSTGRPPARSWPCTTATDLPSRRSRVLCRDCATRD